MEPNRIAAEGSRVVLRPPAPADMAEYLALRKASASFHAPWESTPALGVVAHSEATFAEYLAGSLAKNQERLLICAKDDGLILGAINLSEIVRGAFQSAYVGYWIGAEFANQGFMTEALKLAIRHAFDSLGLHRIEANVRPENVPSIALVKRVGFKLEGFSPRYLKIDGDWRDHERWAVLADDYSST